MLAISQVFEQQPSLQVSGPLTLDHLAPFERQLTCFIRQTPPGPLRLELHQITALDTAGAVFLLGLPRLAQQAGRQLDIGALPERFQPFLTLISQLRKAPPEPPPRGSAMERLGEWLQELNHQLAAFFLLAADLTWSAIAALFTRRGIRRGALLEQALDFGYAALPIVALILFLIGAVSSLQAAAQLRKFGADIFVAELLAIGITRELGPLMTAIIVAGRSGSTIAAEIATMKYTEELDALQTMALDPLRFVAVPKLWAMILCLPLLTIIANFIGILGGIFIGITFMEIAPTAFVNQVVEALLMRDLVTGLIKSASFAWAIAVIGVYRGLAFRGGAAGVGHSTTSSVVASIFGIIVLDAFWGLIFYLR